MRTYKVTIEPNKKTGLWGRVQFQGNFYNAYARTEASVLKRLANVILDDRPKLRRMFFLRVVKDFMVVPLLVMLFISCENIPPPTDEMQSRLDSAVIVNGLLKQIKASMDKDIARGLESRDPNELLYYKGLINGQAKIADSVMRWNPKSNH